MAKKKKRRLKKPVRIAIVALVVLLVLGIVALLGWFQVKKIKAGYMKDYQGTETTVGEDVEITIPEGESTKGIAKILKEAGLITYERAFVERVKESPYRGALQPGTYVLNTGMNTGEMIEILGYVPEGKTVLFTMTVPEGYSIEQIAAKCEEQQICSADEFINAVENGSYDYSFLNEIEPKDGVKYRLQGFLFPATYDIYEDTTAESLVDTMLATFEAQYDGECIAQAESMGYSLYDVITMASIVEREAAMDEERPVIASVINNRLKIDMQLQMCPTVLYPITDGMYDKTEVTYDDLEVVSPYNTYKSFGLPVGPICNPGMTSIKAVLYPDDTNYLYYHTDDNNPGYHIFSETYSEHNSTQ